MARPADGDASCQRGADAAESIDGDRLVQSDPGVPAAGGSSLAKSYALTLSGSAGMILLTLFTGVLSARLLLPDGRGALGAITRWVMVISVFSGFGFREGMSWIEAKSAELASVVLTVSVVAVFVTSGIGIVVAEFLIPWGFSAQSEEVVRLAQIFIVTVLPYSACSAFTNLFAARQRFAAVTAMRVGQPCIYGIGLVILWAVDRADVTTVLTVQVVSFVLPAVGAFISLFRQSGIARFDWGVVRKGSAFGIRAFGSTVGFLANSRLDFLILPAVVVASELGLYVVAVSAGSMIVGLFGSLSFVVFPAVARTGGIEGVRMTQRAIRLVFVAAAGSALILGLLAGVLVNLLYGSEFSGSVAPLRLMLPGVVCWATAQIVTSGLKGVSRPGAASVAQLSGVVVTVVGLLLVIVPYGIRGAAAVSSVSYFIVFFVGLILFTGATETRLRDTLSPRASADDLRWMRRRVTAMLRRPKTERHGAIDVVE